MSNKVPVSDNAGVFVRLIDKSQSPADLAPNQIYGAFAVKCERGFMNQVYRVTSIADRVRFFGKKDWRKLGTSLHDLDKYLESRMPAYVVRAGSISGDAAENNLLAGLQIVPASSNGSEFGFKGSDNQIYDESPLADNSAVTYTIGVTDPEGEIDPSKVQITISNLQVYHGQAVSLTRKDTDETSPTFGEDVLRSYRISITEAEGAYSVVVLNETCEALSGSDVPFTVSSVTVDATTDLPYVDISTPSSEPLVLNVGESIALPALVAVGDSYKTVNTTYTYSNLNEGDIKMEALPDGIGLTQAQVSGPELPSGVYGYIFARGEGTWGNNVYVELNAHPGNVFAEDDAGRIFEIAIYEAPAGVTLDNSNKIKYRKEFYPYASFNSHDVDQTGRRIFIEDVLMESNYVGVTISQATTMPQSLTVPSGLSILLPLSGGNVQTQNTITSSVVKESLRNQILSYPSLYDSMLIFNAGVEIDNAEFSEMVTDYERGLGITCCTRDDAFKGGVPSSNGNVSSRYVCKYGQWVLTADSDANQDIYTSMTGWIGKIIGQNASVGQLPYAPAGYRRGILQGAKGLSKMWTDKDRLEVVKTQWNPVKYDPLAGYVVWDALTSQTFKSALSNIHVILAYQVMRRGIENTLRGFEFEFNDNATVNTILNMLRGMASGYVAQNYAEEIQVNADDNVIGTDQIRIRWNFRPKEVARTIVVDIIAYPSSQELSISLAA